MTSSARNPVTNLVTEFLDSSGVGDSLLGQIAKGLITRSLSRYAKENTISTNTNLAKAFTVLPQKWHRLMLKDMLKLNIGENERKLLLGLLIASILSQELNSEEAYDPAPSS